MTRVREKLMDDNQDQAPLLTDDEAEQVYKLSDQLGREKALRRIVGDTRANAVLEAEAKTLRVDEDGGHYDLVVAPQPKIEPKQPITNDQLVQLLKETGEALKGDSDPTERAA